MLCCCTAAGDETAVIIDAPSALDADHTKEQSEGAQLEAAAGREQQPQNDAPAAATTPEEDDVGDEMAFMARLTRNEPEEPLGIGVDFADRKVLHICQLYDEVDSPITRYHSTAQSQICHGDYIVSINGLSYETVLSPEKILDMLRLTSVELAIRRPQLFDCVVDRQGQPMGLEFIYCDNGASLIITVVNAGAMQSSAPEVKAGDRIVSVDGAQGGPQVLLRAIKEAAGPMKIKISRLTTA